MSKTFTTPKGTVLPLLNLKSKQYMQVAHRLVWFEEQNPNYIIDPQFLDIKPDFAVCATTIAILNDAGNVVRKARATKKEDKQGFGDFIEKAETGSLGRCLALLGYGTQFAEPDMDEGDRLADSPMPAPASKLVVEAAPAAKAVEKKAFKPSAKKDFKEPVKSAPAEIAEPSTASEAIVADRTDDGWD